MQTESQETDLGEVGPVQGAQAGATIQLGADYLDYARERLSASGFKNELVERLLPTVPRRGEPLVVREGESFGKFQILERLGKGGMAEVHLALDPERQTAPGGDPYGSGGGSGRTQTQKELRVAVKVMKREIALDPEYVRRFLREAANTALIDHPNVVKVHEVGSVSGRLYFTMEVIEGETLKEHLARGPVGEEQGVQILCQLVDGLIAAHERGIGHRDLKPSNIMLVTSQSRYGFQIEGEFDVQVKITDFGLAHMLSLDQSAVMPEGRFLGTAKYVAPEVVKGDAPTLRSDVFSLGILAFQMFAGRAPFHARNKIEYITANVQEEAPRLDTLAPVSAELADLLDAMLRKDPAERPDTAALRRDLRRLVGRKPGARIVVRDDPDSVFARKRSSRRGAKRPTPDTSGAMEPLEAPLGRRSLPVPLPVVLASAALGLALLLGLGLLLSSGSSRDPAHDPIAGPIDDPVPGPDDPGVATGDPLQPGSSGAQGGGSGSGDGTADALLVEVPVPPAASFRDRLARTEFSSSLTAGDRAWREENYGDALVAWSRTLELSDAPPEALRRRVRAARRLVASSEATAAERLGEYERAVRAYEMALQAGPLPANVARGDLSDDELRARRQRANARLEHARTLERGLNRARGLALDPSRREEVRSLLLELEPLARALGQLGPLETLRQELGIGAGTPDGSGTTGVPGDRSGQPGEAPDGPGKGPGKGGERPANDDPGNRLVARAEELLRQRSYDAAELALRKAEERTGRTPRIQAAVRRLQRARKTPTGAVFLELEELAEDGLPHACYARLKRVVHREYHAWFRDAAGRAPLVPPTSWAGTGSPPANQGDEPVTGVRREEASRFAEARGERLLSTAERAALAAYLRVELEADGEVFPEGFRTARDMGAW